MRAPFGFVALVVCWACGGSSSETPPPLEPDPARLKSAVPGSASEPSPGSGEGDVIQPSGEQTPPAKEPPLRDGSAAPARREVQTWGAAAPRRATPRSAQPATPSPATPSPAAPARPAAPSTTPPPELAPEPEL